jgi:hypothetical protein
MENLLNCIWPSMTTKKKGRWKKRRGKKKLPRYRLCCKGFHSPSTYLLLTTPLLEKNKTFHLTNLEV